MLIALLLCCFYYILYVEKLPLPGCIDTTLETMEGDRESPHFILLLLVLAVRLALTEGGEEQVCERPPLPVSDCTERSYL